MAGKDIIMLSQRELKPPADHPWQNFRFGKQSKAHEQKEPIGTPL